MDMVQGKHVRLKYVKNRNKFGCGNAWGEIYEECFVRLQRKIRCRVRSHRKVSEGIWDRYRWFRKSETFRFQWCWKEDFFKIHWCHLSWGSGCLWSVPWNGEVLHIIHDLPYLTHPPLHLLWMSHLHSTQKKKEKRWFLWPQQRWR